MVDGTCAPEGLAISDLAIGIGEDGRSVHPTFVAHVELTIREMITMCDYRSSRRSDCRYKMILEPIDNYPLS